MKKKYFFMACLATIFMVSACNDDDDNARTPCLSRYCLTVGY